MRKLLFLFAILLVCVSWFAWTYRVRLTTEALTRALGVPTQVQDVEISTHGLIIRGLAMGFPDDSEGTPSVTVDSIRATFRPWQMWQNPVRVSELSIDGVYLVLDVSSWHGMAKNWASLFDNLATRDVPKPVKESHGSVSDDAPRTYVIDQVIVTNVFVAIQKNGTASFGGAAPVVGRLELRDVGSESPRSLAQTTQLVLGAVLEQATVLHPQIGSVADRVVRNADAELQKVLKSIQDTTSNSGTWQKVKSWFDWSR